MNTTDWCQPIATWTVPHAALLLSFAEMARDGELGREGIALWAGTRAVDTGGAISVSVTHVIVLRGPDVYRSRGFIRIASNVLNDVTDVLSDLGGGVYLAGQIHGHPPECAVDLSPTDIAHGIAAPNYLSVVAPRFGMTRSPDLNLCGVHVFAPPRWNRLSVRQVKAHVSLTHATIALITVGDSPPSAPESPSVIADSNRGGLLDVQG
jgi:hypothetical protein